ncbi:MAG TPA: cytochrome c3 family protein [Anaeromyxobacteraceae bacterium]|nr:cytochrome c3 family protein [Anaeromyxobacteraceae bacterium]
MRSRIAALLVTLLASAMPTAALAQAKFKLKPGAGGQACLECHGAFADQLRKASVHTPVKAKECTGCHNPHASDHKALLGADPSRSCLACHAMVPEGAKSVHQPAAEVRCTGCHDPHASPNKFNLVKPAGELCASCHAKLTQAAAKAGAKHRPVEQGCTTCHDPHASTSAPHVLKKAVPALCVGCHKVDKPVFAKRHFGYDVSKSDCVSCHDPHGSSRRGLLYDKVHSPVAKGMCSQCHQAPGSAAGFQPKQAGVPLCQTCHGPKVAQILSKNRVHAAALAGDACLECHSPHASKVKGLLRAEPARTCGSCHGDTMRRTAAAASKHQPVADGDCTSCHDPHSGDAPLLFAKASVLDTCGGCHDWLKHASHPMGEKVKDPRNRNLRVDCLSCHRGHGTGYKKMLLNATQTEMCTKCHEKYQR